jgi:hypothetical protein
MLANRAQCDESPEVRRAALARLEDHGLLSRVAGDATDPEIRAAARERLHRG